MSQDHGFTVDVFERVPNDAVRLSAFQTNMESMFSFLEVMMEEVGSDEYAQMSEEIGVDVINDIFGNLGERGMFYMSESTGGGGLLSSVVMLELNDSDAFGEAHSTLIDRLNELAAEEIDGYVRVQSREIHGVPSFTFTVPGLPIPLEPSWAITDDALILALSPGSLEIAIAQNNGLVDSSLLDNKSFKESVIAKMPNGEAFSVSYFDASRLAKKGYGMTSMFTSALANAARSPSNPDRVIGSLIPNYASFTSGIAPSGMVTYWDGDDLCTYYTGDESALVQLSAGLGMIADIQGLVIPAIVGSAIVPAIGAAQERANELNSATQVRSIAQGIIIYSGNNQDRFPESMAQMIDQGLIEQGLLESPFGPSVDDGPDYAIRVGVDFENYIFDARCVIAIDRALVFLESEHIPVAFADAHVEEVDIDGLIEILSWPENKGAAEAFDLDWFLED